MPATTFDELIKGLKLACREYNSYGIGTVRDPFVMSNQMPVYQALWEQNELTVRSRLMLSPMAPALAERMAIIEGFGVRSGFGDDLLKLWGLKFVLDGGAEGGALDDPYVNNPGYRGHLLWNPDDLFTLTNFAVRRGWKIGTHAIGDRAVRTLLDVYEQVITENPGLKPGTLVLEHGFLADATQRARAIRLGIPVTIQHPLLYTLGTVLLEGWGEERTREIMPVRAWLEEGASVSAGTDHPVSSFNPLLSIWGMVTRDTLKAGIQGPEYAIDQYTAVQLYTVAVPGSTTKVIDVAHSNHAGWLTWWLSRQIRSPARSMNSHHCGPSLRWLEAVLSTMLSLYSGKRVHTLSVSIICDALRQYDILQTLPATLCIVATIKEDTDGAKERS